MDMCSINICYGVVHILKLLYNCKKYRYYHSQKPTKKHQLILIDLVLVLMARF